MTAQEAASSMQDAGQGSVDEPDATLRWGSNFYPEERPAHPVTVHIRNAPHVVPPQDRHEQGRGNERGDGRQRREARPAEAVQESASADTPVATVVAVKRRRASTG
jgi:hypothetical protein